MALYRASPDDPADRLKTLAKISQEQAGSVQGRIAQLTLARTKLEEGMSEIYVNETEDDAIKKYEEAQKKLKEAKEQFVALIGELREPKILNQESILGAAQAAEGLGNFDEALKYYGQLQNKYPNSLYAERAKEKTEYIKAHRAELDQLVKSLKPEEKKDTGTSTDTNKDEKKDTGTSTDTNKDEKNKNTTEDSKKEDGTKEDSKKEEKDNIEKK